MTLKPQYFLRDVMVSKQLPGHTAVGDNSVAAHRELFNRGFKISEGLQVHQITILTLLLGTDRPE